MVFPGPEGVSVSLLNEVAGKVGATELRIATEDGETLYGWHRAAVWSGPRRVVLYFHGNASSLLAQIELQNLLLSEGWDFVGIHYRGYPGSSGVPSEAGLTPRCDGRVALGDRRARHRAEPGGDSWAEPGRWGGRAARGQGEPRRPGDGVDVHLVGRASPRSTIPFFRSEACCGHRFMTREFAGKVSCPVLVAHGRADTLIDVHHGKELARLFRADEYIEVPRMDHNDMLLVGTIAARYLEFLEAAVPGTPQ